MTTASNKQQSLEDIYAEVDSWHVNTGGETIHAKRMGGKFRNLKWASMITWLFFFVGPYMRWEDKQAILLDIPNRQFHIFSITILPQDVWMLALLLLFFAILLAVVTSIAGRVFCGYFCFQTVWTDIFTWIEEKLEGKPAQRRKLEQASWDFHKIGIKVTKHIIWIAIGIFTGMSFTFWFGDAMELWRQYLNFDASTIAYASIAVFTGFTYLFAGFMREQVCFWLCPYARIQGVMLDQATILPAYDFVRGEPRGKLKRSDADNDKGDCVSCNQCVAVCPTGVDIRDGQQEGCITCALCIDACDAVMDKLEKPRGLIRYASYEELSGLPHKKVFQRPRVWVYVVIMTLSLAGIVYGLTHLGALELHVLHERQPMFVMQSDGSIQNRYELKILNKTHEPMHVAVQVDGLASANLKGAETALVARPGALSSHTVFVKVPPQHLSGARQEIIFTISDSNDDKISAQYTSMFFGPDKE